MKSSATSMIIPNYSPLTPPLNDHDHSPNNRRGDGREFLSGLYVGYVLRYFLCLQCKACNHWDWDTPLGNLRHWIFSHIEAMSTTHHCTKEECGDKECPYAHTPTPAKEDLGDTLMWTRRIRIATDEERAAELLRSLLLRERQRILEGLPQQVPHIGWPTQAHRDYLMGYNNALAEVKRVLNES